MSRKPPHEICSWHQIFSCWFQLPAASSAVALVPSLGTMVVWKLLLMWRFPIGSSKPIPWCEILQLQQIDSWCLFELIHWKRSWCMVEVKINLVLTNCSWRRIQFRFGHVAAFLHGLLSAGGLLSKWSYRNSRAIQKSWNVHHEGEGVMSLAGYIGKLMLEEIPALRRSFQVRSFWKAPRLVQRVLRFSEKTVAIWVPSSEHTKFWDCCSIRAKEYGHWRTKRSVVACL